MKLCIQQRVFTFFDKFTACDVNGNCLYYVNGEFSLFAKKLRISDSTGNEILCLDRRVFRFLPTVDVSRLGSLVFSIKKQISFFTQSYYIEQTGWCVEGDFFAHSYIIKNGQVLIARIEKEWFTWGDCYTIEYADSDRNLEAQFLAILIGIDIINAASND